MFELGTSLREARLRQGVDLPEAEVGTKIRAKYLRALEEESFESLPAQTYVRGFLRTYAEYLGLEGQLYVDEYNSRYVKGEEEHSTRPRRSQTRPRQNRSDSRSVFIALAAMGIVTALVIAAWRFGDPDQRQNPIPNLAEASATTTRARVRSRPSRPSRPALVRPAVPKVVERPRVAPRPARANLVLVAAGGDCWIDVRLGSAEGRQIFVGTMAEGTRKQFVARRLWINVGAPGTLTVRLTGKRVSLPTGGDTQVVSVTPERIAPA